MHVRKTCSERTYVADDDQFQFQHFGQPGLVGRGEGLMIKISRELHERMNDVLRSRLDDPGPKFSPERAGRAGAAQVGVLTYEGRRERWASSSQECLLHKMNRDL